jgi:hypothetical protein
VTTTSLAIHDVAWERLQLVHDINLYDGEPPAVPPYDEDGRVAAYACLYSFPGALYGTALTGDQQTLLGSFQITCVGGDFPRTLDCLDQVRSTVPGAVTVGNESRVIRLAEGQAAPVIRTDEAVWPPRHYVPLDFHLFAP